MTDTNSNVQPAADANKVAEATVKTEAAPVTTEEAKVEEKKV